MRRRALTVVLVLLCGAGARARVGGGQHYSSPSHSTSRSSSSSHGSSSSSHSSSSSSSSWSVRPSGGSTSRSGTSTSGGTLSDPNAPYASVPAPTFLLFRHPLLFMALVLLAVVLIALLSRSLGASASTQRALEERDALARLQISPEEVASWVEALRRRDPAFQLEGFLGRVRALFLETQVAWAAGDLTPVRRFLSDATWQRFRVQLGLLRGQGLRNVTAEMAVTGLELVGLEQNPWFDTVHVLVRARGRDVDVAAEAPDAAARAAAAHAPAEPFTEVWSLVRKPGVKSAGGETLQARTCPSCGAPFEGGAASTCIYCKAVVNSGAYDWVLAEITQTVEVARADAPVPGLEALRQRDPGLSLEVLEDRASLVFWRWVEAQSTGQPERVARLARAPCLERLRAEVERLRAQGAGRVFLECAVGEVRIRAFERSEGQTLAHVEIRWSARTGVGPLGEQPPDLPVLPQRWVFTLARAEDASSRVDTGMSTDRCPQCGGPLGDELDPTCPWCSTVLAGDGRDWTLVEAGPVEAWEGRATAPEMAPASPTLPDVEERERLLYTLAAMALADGEVDARERRLLLQCAERWGLPDDAVDQALAAGLQPLEQLLPHAHAGEPLLRTLAQLARADGRVDRAERRMLEAVAARLGLSQRLPAVLASVGA